MLTNRHRSQQSLNSSRGYQKNPPMVCPNSGRKISSGQGNYQPPDPMQTPQQRKEQ